VIIGQDQAIAALRQLASDRTGVDPATPSSARLMTAARAALGEDVRPGEIIVAAQALHLGLVQEITRAAVVCETFFCRGPLDFAAVQDHVRTLGNRPISAWSAACATGEEAYTLAAALMAAGCNAPSVLGTDLVPDHIAAANAATYGRWSVRIAELFPLLNGCKDGAYTVRQDVRDRVRFRVHNLLQPLPPRRPFDIIMCRNVLMYLPTKRRRVVLQNMLSVLSKDGLLILSAMEFDPVSLPDGLEQLPMDSVQAFRLRRAGSKKSRPVSAIPSRSQRVQPRAQTRPPATPARNRVQQADKRPPVEGGADAVREHVVILEQIESGRRPRALRRLKSMRQRWPDYLPAMLEEALLESGQGNTKAARKLMQGILMMTDDRPVLEIVKGPEDLPVKYFRMAAAAYLRENRSNR